MSFSTDWRRSGDGRHRRLGADRGSGPGRALRLQPLVPLRRAPPPGRETPGHGAHAPGPHREPADGGDLPAHGPRGPPARRGHPERTDGQQRVAHQPGRPGGRPPPRLGRRTPRGGDAARPAAVNVWFEADLARYLAHRPGVVYWHAAPGTPFLTGAGTLICHRPWDEFVMVCSYDPATETIPHSEAFAVERIRQIVGDPTIKPVIKGFSTWTINHQVARHYQAGRVLAMGDAVHRHPPTNGLGLNTSIADAFNLAWKLALVVQGQAGPALLESYSAERQPVGRQVVDRAMQSAAEMTAVKEALGFAPDQSEADGWAALDGLYQPGPAGDRRRAGLRDAQALMNYQFNAHGIELGYRYRAGAVVPDGSPEPLPVRDPQLYYQPTTWPGAHLPHAWLDGPRGRISTLDLVAGTHFSLLTGIRGEGWRDAARP